MKNRIVLMLVGCFVFLLSSCLKSDEVEAYDVTTNCQISSFSLSSDSVPGLSSVNFTIDQLSGEIYNLDSMPYGTEIEKVLCTLSYASSVAVSGTEVSPEALKDSTYWWSSSDSIDFSKSVKFVVHAYDGITTKVYRAWVNIHQVIPDSMVWGKSQDPMIDINFSEQKVIVADKAEEERYFMYVKPVSSGEAYRLYSTSVDAPSQWQRETLSGFPASGAVLSQLSEFNGAYYLPTTEGKLYVSNDGLTWSESQNAPKVIAVMGSVKASSRQQAVLSVVAEQEGDRAFYALDESGEWTRGAQVMESFPIKNFASLQYASMYYEYLSAIGGRSSQDKVVGDCWATSDGLNWSLMSTETNAGFGKREGSMVAAYDDQLFMIGGLDGDGVAKKDVYRSFDKGLTWTKADSMVLMPTSFEARGFSSIVVDDKNFVNLFGGKGTLNGNEFNQLWRGRIFRLVTGE